MRHTPTFIIPTARLSNFHDGATLGFGQAATRKYGARTYRGSWPPLPALTVDAQIKVVATPLVGVTWDVTGGVTAELETPS
jgi:hypothetical protein